MKQYLTLKSKPELTNQIICKVLGKRFPTYDVYIKNNSVRVKKNALVTVAVKANHEKDQSVISVGTLMPWWVWAIIGWLPYLIVKRGFVEEIFSTLLRDFRLMYPNSISECYSPNNLIEWKNKTKSLSTLSTILLIWIACFSYFMFFFWPFINNMIFKDNWEEQTTFIRLYSFTYLIPSFLWLLIGTKLVQLGKQNIKYAGVLIMTFAVFSLCNNILSILIRHGIYIIKMPGYYIHIHSIIDFILLFSAGCLISKNTCNGATRYLSFALLLWSVVNLIAYIVNHVIIDYENMTSDIIGLITAITSVCTSPFCYVAYVLIFRAFHKLPKYPI